MKNQPFESLIKYGLSSDTSYPQVSAFSGHCTASGAIFFTQDGILIFPFVRSTKWLPSVWTPSGKSFGRNPHSPKASSPILRTESGTASAITPYKAPFSKATFSGIDKCNVASCPGALFFSFLERANAPLPIFLTSGGRTTSASVSNPPRYFTKTPSFISKALLSWMSGNPFPSLSAVSGVSPGVSDLLPAVLSVTAS